MFVFYILLETLVGDMLKLIDHDGASVFRQKDGVEFDKVDRGEYKI